MRTLPLFDLKHLGEIVCTRGLISFLLSVFSQRSYIDTKGWDVFRTLPPEASTRSEAVNSKWYFFTIKLLKVVMILLSFGIVLAGCVAGKISLLMMTSQIRPMKTVPFCNVEIDRSKNYVAEISDSERVSL